MKDNVRTLTVMLLLGALLLPVFLGLPVFASDITNAEFYGIIRIVNNSTAVTNITSNITNIEVTDLVNGGYITSASNSTLAMRTSSGADVAFQPGYLTNTWMTFVSSLAASGQDSYVLYCNNVTGGKTRYFPGTAGMTRNDVAGLELGGNFTLEDAGYVKTTGTSQWVVYKQDAFVTYAHSGNVTSSIVGSPTAVVSSLVYATENTSYNMNTIASWVAQTFTTTDYLRLELINLQMVQVGAADNVNAGIYATDANGNPSGAALTSITVGEATGAIAFDVPDITLEPNVLYAIVAHLTLGDDVEWRGDNAAGYSGGQRLTSADSGVTWTAVPTVDMKFNLTGKTVSQVKCSGAITEGEHIIKTTADGTDLKLYVDNVEVSSTALGGVTVTDNANNWAFLLNGVMPYMEYHRITVGGNLKQYVYWEYAATLTDHSGWGLDMTTTNFAVDSSDADVTASLTSFLPITEATAPAYALGVAPDFIATAPNLTSDFSDTVTPTVPGGDVITAIATSSGTPNQLLFTIITCIVILTFSILATYIMRKYGTANSMFVKMFIIVAIMGISVSVGVFDFWMIIFFLIPALALAWASRSQGQSGVMQ